MNDNLSPCCGNCMFAMPTEVSVVCRRFPPKVMVIGGAPQFGPGPQTWWQRLFNIPGKTVIIGMMPGLQAHYPELARDRWCGEHKDVAPSGRSN